MRLILSGGGAHPQTKEINQLYAGLIDKNKPVLYIPVAMNSINFSRCKEWITIELNSYGIYNIEMVEDMKAFSKCSLDEYSSIYIGGGNTYSLLAQIKIPEIYQKIKEYLDNDGVIFGGSAGAIIFGYTINSCYYKDENNVNLKDTYGFNVLKGYSLCCHYDDDNIKEQYAMNQFVYRGNKIIAIPEETSLYINNDVITVIGSKPCVKMDKKSKNIYFPTEKIRLSEL